MDVRGLTLEEIEDVTGALELKLSNERIEYSRNGNRLLWVKFKLSPVSSKGRYARKSWSGRRLNACSYFGFRDFILALFVTYQQCRRSKIYVPGSLEITERFLKREPIRVKSSLGDWTSRGQFISSLQEMGEAPGPPYSDFPNFISLSNENFGEDDPYLLRSNPSVVLSDGRNVADWR